MTDTEIHDLLERIETPPADVADDVARGVRALRRRHRWQIVAASVSVVALAGAGLALTGHADGSRSPGFSDQPGSARAASHAAKPRQSSQAHRRALAHRLGAASTRVVLLHYRMVLADHLDPSAMRLSAVSNEQGGGGTLGTKLDWNDGGMLEIVVGTHWGDAASFYLLEHAGMQPTTYDGRPARVSTTGDDTVVSVQHSDGTVVTLIASTSFGNNGTSTGATDLTQHQLLDAAADPRLALPSDLR